MLPKIRSIKQSIVYHAIEKCLGGGTLRMRAPYSELYCIIYINSAFIRTKKTKSEPWDHRTFTESRLPLVIKPKISAPG